MEAHDNHTVNECIALAYIIHDLETVIELLDTSQEYREL